MVLHPLMAMNLLGFRTDAQSDVYPGVSPARGDGRPNRNDKRGHDE